MSSRYLYRLVFRDGNWLNVLHSVAQCTEQKSKEQAIPEIVFPSGVRLPYNVSIPALGFTPLYLLVEQDQLVREDWLKWRKVEMSNRGEKFEPHLPEPKTKLPIEVSLYLDYRKRLLHPGEEEWNPNLVEFQFAACATSQMTLFRESQNFRSIFVDLLKKHNGYCGFLDGSTDVSAPGGPHEVFWLRDKPLEPPVSMTETEIASYLQKL